MAQVKFALPLVHLNILQHIINLWDNCKFEKSEFRAEQGAIFFFLCII